MKTKQIIIICITFLLLKFNNIVCQSLWVKGLLSILLGSRELLKSEWGQTEYVSLKWAEWVKEVLDLLTVIQIV